MNACAEHQAQGRYCPYCVIEHYIWVNKKQKDRIKKLSKELATYKAVEEMAELRQNDKNF
jgi:hypothetical protein